MSSGFEFTDAQLEQVMEENKDLKKALKAVKCSLDRTSDDYLTLKNIHEEFKQHFQKMKSEKTELEQKMAVLLNEKKESENNAEQVVKVLRRDLNDKDREIEYIQAKVLPSLDQDMLRVRLLHEIEVPHRLELEAKQMEIDRLTEKQYELKRQVELLKTQNEVSIAEAGRNIKQMKEKHKIDLKDALLEVQVSADKTIERKREKEQAKIYKKESEDLKAQLINQDEVISNLQKKLDSEKEEKSEQIESLVSELELLREQRGQLMSEKERMQEHIIDLEGEIKQQTRERQGSRNSSKNRIQNDGSKKLVYQESELQEMKENEQIIKSLQEKLQDQKNKFEDEIKMNRKTEKKIEEQVDKLRKEKRDLESEHTRITGELNDRNYEERRKVSELQARIKELERENESLRDKSKSFEKPKDYSKENITNSSNSANAKIEALEKRNVTLKDKLKLANEKIVKLLNDKILEKKRDQDMGVLADQNAILKNIQESSIQKPYPYNTYSTQPPPYPTNNYTTNVVDNHKLNLTNPVIRTVNSSVLGALSNDHSRQNTGQFYQEYKGVLLQPPSYQTHLLPSRAIESDLNNHRDRLNYMKDHVDDMYKISNQQFYKPYP